MNSTLHTHDSSFVLGTGIRTGVQGRKDALGDLGGEVMLARVAMWSGRRGVAERRGMIGEDVQRAALDRIEREEVGVDPRGGLPRTGRRRRHRLDGIAEVIVLGALQNADEKQEVGKDNHLLLCINQGEKVQRQDGRNKQNAFARPPYFALEVRRHQTSIQ